MLAVGGAVEDGVEGWEVRLRKSEQEAVYYVCYIVYY